MRLFGLKTGIDFAPFGLESGVVFEGTTGVYERILRRRNKTESQNSKQNHKTQNRITKFKTESQNSKQNHKIQNRITKSKIETQNSKQNHKTQNRNAKLKSEKDTLLMRSDGHVLYFFTIKSNVSLTDRGYLNTEIKNLQAMK